MNSVQPYSRQFTDDMLYRVMAEVGDHANDRFHERTGRYMHFDVAEGASACPAVAVGADPAPAPPPPKRDGLLERAVDHITDLLDKYPPNMDGLSRLVTLIGQELTDKVEHKDERPDGLRQWTDGLSDVGVVALVKSLEFDPEFTELMLAAHPAGLGAVASATSAKLKDPAHAEMRDVMLKREDAGYSDVKVRPDLAASPAVKLITQSLTKRSEAGLEKDSARAAQLTKEADDLSRRADQFMRNHAARLAQGIRGDAAYGLGALWALFDELHDSGKVDDLYAKAHAKAYHVVHRRRAPPPNP